MIALLGAGRMRLLGVAVLLATFVVGALAGAALDRVLSAEPTERASDHRDGDRRRSHVIDQVELLPEQRAAIDAILERRADRMRLVWDEVSPRMESITDSARVEIMQVLTPQQRADYEQLLEARAQKRRDREARGDGKKDPTRR